MEWIVDYKLSLAISMAMTMAIGFGSTLGSKKDSEHSSPDYVDANPQGSQGTNSNTRTMNP